jgi:hypothetical protein
VNSTGLVAPFDIHYGTFLWKDCPDERPWVVIGEGFEADTWDCFPLSGQFYDQSNAFEIDPAHPDFQATGLKKRSYIQYESLIVLPAVSFRRKIGKLQGELLDRFLSEAGLNE